MGYEMKMVGSRFAIPAENVLACLAAVKATLKTGKMGGGSSNGERWFAFMNGGRMDALKGATSLDVAMKAWRWPVKLGETGVASIEFIGEKMGDDAVLFDAIAPFVEPGSYVEMVGEDGGRWRWAFDGKTCKWVAARGFDS